MADGRIAQLSRAQRFQILPLNENHWDIEVESKAVPWLGCAQSYSLPRLGCKCLHTWSPGSGPSRGREYVCTVLQTRRRRSCSCCCQASRGNWQVEPAATPALTSPNFPGSWAAHRASETKAGNASLEESSMELFEGRGCRGKCLHLEPKRHWRLGISRSESLSNRFAGIATEPLRTLHQQHFTSFQSKVDQARFDCNNACVISKIKRRFCCKNIWHAIPCCSHA